MASPDRSLASARPAADSVTVPPGARDASGRVPQPLGTAPAGALGGPAGRAGVKGAELGARTVLVLRVDYTDERASDASHPAYAAPEIGERLVAHAQSASKLFAAQSTGTLSLTGRTDPYGDVLPWIHLAGPMPMTATGCDTAQIATDAFGAVAGSLNIAAWDHLVIVFPEHQACPWSGYGEVPGSTSWINGLTEGQEVSDAALLAHELGHNLGVAHASSVACADGAGTPVALSDQCTPAVEYGDPFDLMGGGYPANYPWAGTALMSSWHRAQLLQLATNGQQVAAANGTYVLSDALGVTGTRLLRIPRGSGVPAAQAELALELRSGGALFDAWTAFPSVTGGVIVRLVPAITVAGPSQLLDLAPATPTLADAPLAVGQTFTDPGSGTVIKLISLASGRAELAVTSPRLLDRAPPSAPGNVTLTRDGLDAVLTWTPATDDIAIARYEVVRGGGVALSVGADATSARDRLPQSTGSTTYQVVAVDTGGNRTASGGLSIDLIPAPNLEQQPVPGPTPVPEAGPPEAALSGPSILRPVPRRGRAKLTRTGRIVIEIPGAARISGKVKRVSLGLKRGSRAAFVLPKAVRRQGIVKVRASGGSLRTPVVAELRVTRGIARLVVLS